MHLLNFNHCSLHPHLNTIAQTQLNADVPLGPLFSSELGHVDAGAAHDR